MKILILLLSTMLVGDKSEKDFSVIDSPRGQAFFAQAIAEDIDAYDIFTAYKKEKEKAEIKKEVKKAKEELEKMKKEIEDIKQNINKPKAAVIKESVQIDRWGVKWKHENADYLAKWILERNSHSSPPTNGSTFDHMVKPVQTQYNSPTYFYNCKDGKCYSR